MTLEEIGGTRRTGPEVEAESSGLNEIFNDSYRRVANTETSQWQALATTHQFIKEVQSLRSSVEHSVTSMPEENERMIDLYIAALGRVGDVQDPGLIGLFKILTNTFQAKADMAQLDRIVALIWSELHNPYLEILADRITVIGVSQEGAVHSGNGDQTRD